MTEILASTGLTARQRDCMELVKDGLTAKQIARELGISHRTVEQHIAAAIEILGVSNRLAAVGRLYELEWDEQRSEDHQALMLSTAAQVAERELIRTDLPDPVTADDRAAPSPILPPVGGKANDAPLSVRRAWIIRIAVFAIMLTSAVILSVLGLSELAKSAG